MEQVEPLIGQVRGELVSPLIRAVSSIVPAFMDGRTAPIAPDFCAAARSLIAPVSLPAFWVADLNGERRDQNAVPNRNRTDVSPRLSDRELVATINEANKHDLLDPESLRARLVVETDGLRYHRTPAQQSRDRRRDQAHTAAGLTPLRSRTPTSFTTPAMSAGRSGASGGA